MAGVLITGFEPFGGETVNPSWEVVKQLDGMIIRGQQVVAKQLPCVFGEALTVLKAALETYQPRLTIAVGQAGGRVDITVERVAIDPLFPACRLSACCQHTLSKEWRRSPWPDQRGTALPDGSGRTGRYYRPLSSLR